MTVLPDPPVPGAPAGRWWPPVAMTAAWLTAHAAEFDVLHVHFGLESFSVDELRAALDAARQQGRPVVYTVHDLDNPQLVEQEHHRALLDAIVPVAARLVTLTPGASAEIAERWGRPSTVLAHPSLIGELPAGADARDDARDDTRDGTVRVGMHLRDLRPNIDAERAVRAAIDAARLLADDGRPVDIEVLLSERVRDDAAAARVVAAAASEPSVRVRRVPHLSDAEIEGWLRGLDLFVLPYLHGTHSGWVELAYDLGVHVVGADVGHIGEQHPSDFSPVDLDEPATLADAVRGVAHTHDSPERAAVLAERHRDRVAERQSVRDAHTALYASVLTETRA